MPVKVKSRVQSVKAQMRSENKKRLRECAKVVRQQARALLSVSGVGKRQRGQVVVAKSARSKGAVIGAFRSRAGDPPRKQTGKLLRSVTHLLIGYSRSRVQTSEFYGRILDSPKYRYGRRPWLKAALDDKRGEIKAILTRPMDLK